MPTLIIQHSPETDPLAFQVLRPDPIKVAKPTVLTSPATVPVGSAEGANLTRELRWYLETFLEYPFEPKTLQAEAVQDALKRWGTQVFEALFHAGPARDWYRDATRDGFTELDLQIASDDPAVLGWPWEALCDPEVGTLAHHCRIERRLGEIRDPAPLPETLPRDRVNILLVTARPYKQDVRYRSLSRPLVELVARQKLPAAVTVLRRPTFEALREHLKDHPGEYHIVHFDGHGGYGVVPEVNPHALKGSTGKLVFETDEGKPDPVEGYTLSQLLREYRVPVMVLNACQSAMVDETAEDAFASVAASLLRAGVRSVVAMSYSLYVSGAEEFLPAFYQRLFEVGSITEAVRAGRQGMLARDGRVCARGRFPLQDWLVPVVYQQDVVPLNFAAQRAAVENPALALLPDEARDAENPYGFVGRDSAVLALERALRRAPPGILIHGLGGVGKTTLVRGFLHWLAETGGLEQGVFWFTFNDIGSAEYVVNRLVEALFGTDAMAAELAPKVEALVRVFREQRFILVWDNFESVQGSAAEPGRMPESDRTVLRDFLAKLRGGATRVLITSRSPEQWLGGPTVCYPLPLGGLDGEERWIFCETVLRDLGMTPDRDDAALVALMDLLNGHPLAMRAVLPQLGEFRAAELERRIRKGLVAEEDAADPALARVFATLRFVEGRIPGHLQSLLIPLGLHERFIDADYLEQMAGTAEPNRTRLEIDEFLGILGIAGLVHRVGQKTYDLHPALTGFLRQQTRSSDATTVECWEWAFTDFMGRLADYVARKEFHEQRVLFHWHGENFRQALIMAERLATERHFAALLQALHMFSLNRRDFAGATEPMERLAKLWQNQGNLEKVASSYHQLGRIAQGQRDFSMAEQWYRKSLEVIGDESEHREVASIYHQLGAIAQERRNFNQAEQKYLKSLAIFEKNNNKYGMASVYHQLGIIAETQRAFDQAEEWYRKSLAIKEEQKDKHGMSLSYHGLGVIAQEQGEFYQAERWYRKSLEITERQGNFYVMAMTFYQLGTMAQECQQVAQAEHYYHKSLAIFEKQYSEHESAIVYRQIGIIAQERQDLAQAEQWYRKSLVIFEKQGNEHEAATTYGPLGVLAAQRSFFVEAIRWLIQALVIFLDKQNHHFAQIALSNIAQCFQQADDQQKATIRELWQETGLGDLPGLTDND